MGGFVGIAEDFSPRRWLFQVEAKVTEEPERTRLYDKMADMLDSFNDYRSKTDRVIPVFKLTPVK